MRELPLPRVVRIESSSLCNLRCLHCPTGIRQDSNRGNMPWEVFCRIVEEISSVDIAVLYHGGEPFLNKDFFKMVTWLKARKVPFVQTNTNGSLLNDEMLAGIVATGLDRIEFSIDGLSPSENNKIRRGADYPKLVLIVKRLLLLKRQQTSSTPEVNIINTQIPTEEDIFSGKCPSVPKYLLDEFAAFPGELSFKPNYMIKWPGLECSDRFKLVEPPVTQWLSRCEQVTEVVTFRWNGDIVPCCYDITGEYIIGNIMNSSLKELWHNDRYRALREGISLYRPPPLCQKCNVLRREKAFVTLRGSL